MPGVDAPELRRLSALGWEAADLPVSPDGVRVVDETVAINYPDEGLAHLGLDGGRGYWFDHRARSVVDVLQVATPSRTIWDVGAGAGSMSVRLASAGYEVVSVEPQPVGAAATAQLECSPVFCASLEGLQLPTRSVGIIGLFDVIEHLDDPAALIAEATRVLEPGGVVVLTVPALQLLWSDADDVAGHQRRYTRRSLDTFMQECGLTRVSSAYLFASLVPPAIALRTVPYRLGRRRTPAEVMAATQRRLAPKPHVDAVARRVLDAERAVARRVPLPVGLSVLGAYRTSAA